MGQQPYPQDQHALLLWDESFFLLKSCPDRWASQPVNKIKNCLHLFLKGIILWAEKYWCMDYIY